MTLMPAIAAALIELALTFKLFFDDFNDNFVCWTYSFKPDFRSRLQKSFRPPERSVSPPDRERFRDIPLWSFLQGEGFDDWRTELKVAISHGLGILTGFLIYHRLEKCFR